MITIPDFERNFEYENDFILSCKPPRIGKLLAHYEIFSKIIGVSGDIVECGVFKGSSFCRFAMFRKLFELEHEKKLIGFDSFDQFPESNYQPDQDLLGKFIAEAGTNSIACEQLTDVLINKECQQNVELIAGNICQTVPEWISKNKQLKISLLHIDVDVFEPTKTILDHLWDHIVPGGILMLDDYNVFPGETDATNEFFEGQLPTLHQHPFSKTPTYIIKGE